MGTKADQILAMEPGTRFSTNNDISKYGEENLPKWMLRTEDGYRFVGEGAPDTDFPEYMIPLIFTEKMPVTGHDWELVVLS